MTEGEEPWSWRAATFGGLVNGAGAALVAVFCYVTASRVSQLREAYWAPIAAIVVLYPDRESTKKAGVERFAGTAIGCLVGWGCASLWHQHVLFWGAGVVLAVSLCHILKVQSAARLCAVAATVITIIPHPEPPHLVALHRFVEVSYGVACALGYTAAFDYVARRAGRKAG